MCPSGPAAAPVAVACCCNLEFIANPAVALVTSRGVTRDSGGVVERSVPYVSVRSEVSLQPRNCAAALIFSLQPLFLYHACLNLNSLTSYSLPLSSVTRAGWGVGGRNVLIAVKTVDISAVLTLKLNMCFKTQECSSSARSWSISLCVSCAQEEEEVVRADPPTL